MTGACAGGGSGFFNSTKLPSDKQARIALFAKKSQSPIRAISERTGRFIARSSSERDQLESTSLF
jgi:hypothetical protein